MGWWSKTKSRFSRKKPPSSPPPKLSPSQSSAKDRLVSTVPSKPSTTFTPSGRPQSTGGSGSSRGSGSSGGGGSSQPTPTVPADIQKITTDYEASTLTSDQLGAKQSLVSSVPSSRTISPRSSSGSSSSTLAPSNIKVNVGGGISVGSVTYVGKAVVPGTGGLTANQVNRNIFKEAQKQGITRGGSYSASIPSSYFTGESIIESTKNNTKYNFSSTDTKYYKDIKLGNIPSVVDRKDPFKMSTNVEPSFFNRLGQSRENVSNLLSSWRSSPSGTFGAIGALPSAVFSPFSFRTTSPDDTLSEQDYKSFIGDPTTYPQKMTVSDIGIPDKEYLPKTIFQANIDKQLGAGELPEFINVYDPKTNKDVETRISGGTLGVPLNVVSERISEKTLKNLQGDISSGAIAFSSESDDKFQEEANTEFQKRLSANLKSGVPSRNLLQEYKYIDPTTAIEVGAIVGASFNPVGAGFAGVYLGARGLESIQQGVTYKDLTTSQRALKISSGALDLGFAGPLISRGITFSGSGLLTKNALKLGEEELSAQQFKLLGKPTAYSGAATKEVQFALGRGTGSAREIITSKGFISQIDDATFSVVGGKGTSFKSIIDPISGKTFSSSGKFTFGSEKPFNIGEFAKLTPSTVKGSPTLYFESTGTSASGKVWFQQEGKDIFNVRRSIGFAEETKGGYNIVGSTPTEVLIGSDKAIVIGDASKGNVRLWPEIYGAGQRGKINVKGFISNKPSTSLDIIEGSADDLFNIKTGGSSGSGGISNSFSGGVSSVGSSTSGGTIQLEILSKKELSVVGGVSETITSIPSPVISFKTTTAFVPPKLITETKSINMFDSGSSTKVSFLQKEKLLPSSGVIFKQTKSSGSRTKKASAVSSIFKSESIVGQTQLPAVAQSFKVGSKSLLKSTTIKAFAAPVIGGGGIASSIFFSGGIGLPKLPRPSLNLKTPKGGKRIGGDAFRGFSTSFAGWATKTKGTKRTNIFGKNVLTGMEIRGLSKKGDVIFKIDKKPRKKIKKRKK